MPTTKKIFEKQKEYYLKITKHKQFILVLSVLIGVCTGLAAVILKTSVHYIEMFVRDQANIESENFFYLFLPVIGIIFTVGFIYFFIKDDIGHGVSRILYSLSRGNAKMKKHNIYSSMIGCSITSGFGGSVGMEAPILSTGAAIGANVGTWFNQSYRTRMLLIGAGTAGALAAIFKAPIAGLIFALEVLALDITAVSIIPLLISSVSGALVSTFLYGNKVEFYFTLKDTFDYSNIPFYIVFGIFCGFVSVYFLRTNRRIENGVKKIKSIWARAIIGGLAVGALIFIFPPLYGEGYNAMKIILSGNLHDLTNNSYFYNFDENSWIFVVYLGLILLFKVAATSITTGSGGVGGVFAPALFMGAISGAIFVKIINFSGIDILSPSNFVLTGMAGLISGVIFTPLTGIFLIAELTGGYELFIPLIITSSLAYLTTRIFESHSIYTRNLAKQGDLITHDRDKTVLTLMQVGDVIEKNFISLQPEQNLGDIVFAVKQSNRNIFPVCDMDNKFMGVIALDDLRCIMFDAEKYDKLLVKDLMQVPPLVVEINENMENVLHKFRKIGYWNLPVVNDGKYVGFVSRSNVFTYYRNRIRDFSMDDK